MHSPSSTSKVLLLAACLFLLTSVAGWAQDDASDATTDPGRGVYVYVDGTLARSAEILALSTALAERAEALADLGEVTVVVAAPDPRVHFRGTGVAAIRQGLSTLGLRTFGDEQLVRLRSDYAESGAAVRADPDLRRQNADFEGDLLRARYDTLIAWLADEGEPEGGRSARTLVLLEPALGVDPYAFYQVDGSTPLPDIEALTEVATAWGWRVSPVGLIEEEGGLTVGPADPGIAGIRLGLPGRPRDTGFRPDLQLDIDRDLYARFADLAGGTPIHVQPDLDQVLALSSNPQPRGSGAGPLLSEALIQARGRIFLDGGDEGEVELLSTIERGDNGFHLSVSLDPELPLDHPHGYAVHVLEYGESPQARVRTWEWPAGEHAWNAPEPVPGFVDQVAVLFSAVDGSTWGIALAGEGVIDEQPVRSAQSLLTIPDLPSSGLAGRQRFTIDAGPEVDRVEVLLDGKRVDGDRRRPFNVSIGLGPAAVEHSLVVIGYDSAGREVVRDGRTLNSSARFDIEITSPTRLRAGAMDVVAEVTSPGDRAVRSVDFYWRTERVARDTEAPWRQRILVPLDHDEDGYVRVVATLEDGRVAEDILLAGRDNFSSEVQVELMELYVVVTDKDERPVRDLGASAFEILEHGEPQHIAHFRVAGDLPLTVGLTIDSSLSLFKKLPDVQKAARGFVRSLVPSRDRAFLVGFGDRPALEQPPTWDLESVVDSINRLKPSGNTAVWQAVSFSLDQLRAVSGRRALVVFYDGDDEDLSFPFATTLDKAKESQLPIYLVVLNDEAARTQGEGFAVRSRIGRLEKLAAAGGGRVFYVRTDQDLEPVFDQIAEELRAHYLLAYYPEDPSFEAEWRPVRVEVEGPGLTARTVEGYVR